MSLRREREVKRLIESAGLYVESMESGRHIKTTAVAANGARKTLIAANSGSDRRGDKNLLAFARRFAKSNQPENCTNESEDSSSHDQRGRN